MKKSEIKVGGEYRAKVSGNLVTVRVDAIRERYTGSSFIGKTTQTRYDVTNLTTGRKTTFRSAAKFRSEVKEPVNLKSSLKETDGYNMLSEADKATYDRLPPQKNCTAWIAGAGLCDCEKHRATKIAAQEPRDDSIEQESLGQIYDRAISRLPKRA